ncbi:MAG TPA: hypothetical protein PKI01_04235 [Bacteroidales bacterium]|nr:hypothetical protein [Bacteroidales bacterium]
MHKKIFTYLIFLLLIFPFSLFSQEEEGVGEILIRPQYQPRSEDHRNKMDELGRKQGLWKYYTREQILYYEITFLNDVKHGPCTRRSTATGVIIEESNYFNGKRDGEYRRYSQKGILTSEGSYTGNRKTGKWITYFPVNGEKKSEGDYVAGKREGVWAYYSSKGKIKAQGEYIAGLREGDWTYYNADGTVAEVKKYIKGQAPEEVKTPKTNEKVVGGFKMEPKNKKNNPKTDTKPKNPKTNP